MLYQDITHFKYRLLDTCAFYVGIFPPGQEDVVHEEVTLTMKGFLILRPGFMWDGASGPAVDTKNFMVPSAVHDAGYLLIRIGAIPRSSKKKWDDLMTEMCEERGMMGLRRAWVHGALAVGGHFATKPDPRRDYIQIIEVY